LMRMKDRWSTSLLIASPFPSFNCFSAH
jgi:hypothetical protein